jgi:hypothetical protein
MIAKTILRPTTRTLRIQYPASLIPAKPEITEQEDFDLQAWIQKKEDERLYEQSDRYY